MAIAACSSKGKSASMDDLNDVLTRCARRGNSGMGKAISSN